MPKELLVTVLDPLPTSGTMQHVLSPTAHQQAFPKKKYMAVIPAPAVISLVM